MGDAKRNRRPNPPVVFIRCDAETRAAVLDIATRQGLSANAWALAVIRDRLAVEQETAIAA